jgi:hypothetical protein
MSSAVSQFPHAGCPQRVPREPSSRCPLPLSSLRISVIISSFCLSLFFVFFKTRQTQDFSVACTKIFYACFLFALIVSLQENNLSYLISFVFFTLCVCHLKGSDDLILTKVSPMIPLDLATRLFYSNASFHSFSSYPLFSSLLSFYSHRGLPKWHMMCVHLLVSQSCCLTFSTWSLQFFLVLNPDNMGGCFGKCFGKDEVMNIY